MLPDIDSRIDGRMMAGTLVTGNFFQVLGVSARARAHADARRRRARSRAGPVVVLSHRGWTRHFANDPAVLGRSLLVNGSPYEIVGVMPEGFRGLERRCPRLLGAALAARPVPPMHAGREDAVGIDIVGRLKPGLSRQTALAGLVVWDSGQPTSARSTVARANITLEPRQGTVPQPAEALLVFTPLFFAFGLILMIGCANVANLLLARAVSRQREIGIRLSLGASRPAHHPAAAHGKPAARARVRRARLRHLACRARGDDPRGDEHHGAGDRRARAPRRCPPPTGAWRVFLVGGAIVSTVFFGLAPALQATRLELVRTIRGEVTRDARPGRARNVLIGVQVTASALLLICSAVFLRSALAASTVDPGIRTADTVIVEIVNEQSADAMVQAVTAEPTSRRSRHRGRTRSARPRAALRRKRPAGKSTVAYKFVSPEYFSVLGIDVLRGRGFTHAERTASAAVAVVSEARRAAAVAGTRRRGSGSCTSSPIRTRTTRRADEPPLPSRTFTVVGVARDVPVSGSPISRKHGVYVPTSAAVPKRR